MQDFFMGVLIVGIITAFIIYKKGDLFISNPDARKKYFRISLIAVAISFVLFGVSGDTEKSKVTSNTNSKKEIVALPTLITTPKEKTLEERLTDIGNDLMKETPHKVILGKTEVTLSYTVGTVLDDNSIVNGNFTKFVKFGKLAFAENDIKSIRVVTSTTMTDSYGKESVEEVINTAMDKTEFEKFDWDNLKYAPLLEKMRSSTSYLWIHPGIMKNVNGEKIKLYL